MVAASAVEKNSRTQRLALAPLNAAHASALHALLDDWEVVKMLSRIGWPVTLESVAAYAASRRQHGASEDAFAVLLRGEPIGVAGVKHPGAGDPPRKMPSLGYWIGRPYWGNGYASEAVAALVGIAFGQFPHATTIGAGVFEGNAASRRVLGKLGFRETGRSHTHSMSRGGLVATIDMQLTRTRWNASVERA